MVWGGYDSCVYCFDYLYCPHLAGGVGVDVVVPVVGVGICVIDWGVGKRDTAPCVAVTMCFSTALGVA